MDKLTVWLKISAVSAVASAVILAVMPQSKLKNTYRIISVFIVLFSLFSAFTSSELTKDDFFYENTYDSAYLDEKTDELLVREGEELLDNILSEKLNESGFALRCESDFLIDDDKMVIDTITVYGKINDEEKERIIKIIYETVKEESEVIFAQEDYEE